MTAIMGVIGQYSDNSSSVCNQMNQILCLALFMEKKDLVKLV